MSVGKDIVMIVSVCDGHFATPIHEHLMILPSLLPKGIGILFLVITRGTTVIGGKGAEM